MISPRGPIAIHLASRLPPQPSLDLVGELKKGYRLCQLRGGTVKLHPILHLFSTHLLPQKSQGLLSHQGHLFLPWDPRGLLLLQIPECLEHLLHLCARPLLWDLVCLEVPCSPASQKGLLFRSDQSYLEVLEVHMVQNLPLLQVLQQSHFPLWVQLDL